MSTVDDQAPSSEPSAARSWLLLGLVAVGLAAIWRFTPLARLLDRAYLGHLARTIAAAPSAPALAVAAYVVLLLLLFPLTPLVAATALVFDPWRAYGISLLGALVASALGWVAGRLVARHRPRWIEARRFQPLRARLQRRGFLTMALTRLVPAGNFTIANVVGSAIGVPFRAFMLGNAVGLQPGLLLLTLLAHEARRLGWVR
ncbi:MAG TPA: VTT domain-containing protein [Polyangia bacterium]|nr:VTT domain-containing protein [Polyangia bacterium]